MRILLDHCVDWRLMRSLPAHQIKTAGEMGWDRMRNGKLLATAAGEFDAVITTDQNMKHQQNLAALPIAVVVLIAKSNKLSDLLPLVPQIEQTLQNLPPRSLVEVHFLPP